MTKFLQKDPKGPKMQSHFKVQRPPTTTTTTTRHHPHTQFAKIVSPREISGYGGFDMIIKNDEQRY